MKLPYAPLEFTDKGALAKPAQADDAQALLRQPRRTLQLGVRMAHKGSDLGDAPMGVAVGREPAGRPGRTMVSGRGRLLRGGPSPHGP